MFSKVECWGLKTFKNENLQCTQQILDSNNIEPPNSEMYNQLSPHLHILRMVIFQFVIWCIKSNFDKTFEFVFKF